MKKGQLRLIPLQADLCLNKQKVDIEDFKGWQDCNAPVYGDCLSPLYKLNDTHHDIFIGDDKYDFTSGTLYKNGAAVLSGAGSKKLKKTKINDNYSSIKITEDNLLSWVREVSNDTVQIKLGNAEVVAETVSNCTRIVATKMFGDSDKEIYGCVVWYLSTNGKYGYFLAWTNGGTYHTSYGENDPTPTLYEGWEVIAPLIQVAIPTDENNDVVLISLFGNSGADIPSTQVKNVVIYNDTVYDNPSFVDTTNYPTRYETITEKTGMQVMVATKVVPLVGRDYNATGDNDGAPCVRCEYMKQEITFSMTSPLSVPITVECRYYKLNSRGGYSWVGNPNKTITIPANVTTYTVSNEIFGAWATTRGNEVLDNNTLIGKLKWRNNVLYANDFTSQDTFLPVGYYYIGSKTYASLIAFRMSYTTTTGINDPTTAGTTETKTDFLFGLADHKKIDDSPISFWTRTYVQDSVSSMLRHSDTETISSMYQNYYRYYVSSVNYKANYNVYPYWNAEWGNPVWLLTDYAGIGQPGYTDYANSSATKYQELVRYYKEAYTEQALKECDCVLDDNRLYCVGDIVDNTSEPMPVKCFGLAGTYLSFTSGTKKINYRGLANFNISYQNNNDNIYPKYYVGKDISIQDKYLRILYKFKKNAETNEIIYFGVDSSSIKSSEGKNVVLYPGVRQETDSNLQGACLNAEGWRLLFNNNMLSNVACYEEENYIGTILADWLSIDTDFHTTFNATKLYYRDNTKVIWLIEKVDSGEEWQYRVIENRYIVLNTTNYFNCYDTQTGLKRHWASDYNNRVMFGYAFSQYEVNSTFTNLFKETLFRGLLITGQNANFERTKDTITSLELGAIIYERCLKDYMSFISCDTPYGAMEGIDMYRGDDDSTSAIYICSFQNGLKYIDTDLTNPYAVYPIADGGNVRYNPNLFTRFITSYNNKDMVISDGVAYKLLYFNNVVPIMSYYLLDGVESLENAFVLQSTYYGVSTTRLYQMNYNNGVGVEVVCDITNMEYLGALPTQALFWSAQNRAIYAFTGSCIMQLRQYANELTNIYNKWYNPATQELFLDTNIGLLVFSDLGTYCLKDLSNKRIKDIFFFADYFIINLFEEPTTEVPVIYSHYYSYNNKTGYESNHILFLTKYYGNAHTPITINNIYVRLYNQAEVNPAGYITFKGHTITDMGTHTDQRVVSIGGEDNPTATPPTVAGEQWDEETGTMLVKYTPQYNRGLGFALEVDTTFPIIDIKFDYVEDGGVESQISHINI